MHLTLGEMSDAMERAVCHPVPPTTDKTEQQELILFKFSGSPRQLLLVHHIRERLEAPSVITSSEPLLPTKPYYPGKC